MQLHQLSQRGVILVGQNTDRIEPIVCNSEVRHVHTICYTSSIAKGVRHVSYGQSNNCSTQQHQPWRNSPAERQSWSPWYTLEMTGLFAKDGGKTHYQRTHTYYAGIHLLKSPAITIGTRSPCGTNQLQRLPTINASQFTLLPCRLLLEIHICIMPCTPHA